MTGIAHICVKVQMPVGTRNSLANNIPDSRGTSRLFLHDSNQGVVSSLPRSELPLVDLNIVTCALYNLIILTCTQWDVHWGYGGSMLKGQSDYPQT